MTLRELVKTIDKKEWRFVILLCIVMILITGLPYVYAYLNAPQGYFYNGIHSLTSADTPVYFSYINQIKSDQLMIKDNFTSENQPIGIINLVWLIVGLLAYILNLQPFWAFFIFRLFLIPICLIIFYIFTSYFFSDQVKRKLTLIFICFSSGIGIYFANLFNAFYPNIEDGKIYKWPIDLWLPESNMFLSLYQSPHLILSWTLMILFFLFMLLALSNNKFFYSILAGLIGFFWFNFHPYYFPAVFIIVFIYALILFWPLKRWSMWLHYILSLILSLPFIIYHYYLIKTDFFIGTRAARNIALTPPFIFVFLGFGFLLIFAVAGLIYQIKAKNLFKNKKIIFLTVWLIIGLILLYMPFNWQRRFLMGLQIPMVFFTVIFLVALTDFCKKKYNKLFLFLKKNYLTLTFIFIFFFGLSNVFDYVRDFYFFKNQLPLFYLSNDYLNAANWLKINNQNNKIILSQNLNGLIIPSLVNQRVFLAHGHETIDFNAKTSKVNDYFANKYSEKEATKFLQENNIGYIFYTNIEKNKLAIDEQKYLNKVFSSEQIQIFEFIN